MQCRGVSLLRLSKQPRFCSYNDDTALSSVGRRLTPTWVVDVGGALLWDGDERTTAHVPVGHRYAAIIVVGERMIISQQSTVNETIMTS